MNKKFFTQLMGVFLFLLLAFSANAQGSDIDNQPLKLGDRVKTLKAKANDYYHLKVTGFTQGHATADSFVISPFPALVPNSELVLYMGQPNQNGDYSLFFDELNMSTLQLTAYKQAGYLKGASRAERSAASLWCTSVRKYNEGQNITYDFTNKYHQNQLLEVSIDGYETWGHDGMSFVPVKVQPDSALAPGDVGDWHFSDAYLTSVDQDRILMSYITKDTVAALAVDGKPFLNTHGRVVIKIFAAKDLYKISNLLTFTLHEAAPFTLSPTDFNTMFGSKPDTNGGKLKFSPNSSGKNVFANLLEAETIVLDPTATYEYYKEETLGVVPDPAVPFGPHWMVGATHLDFMGYIYLKDKKNSTSYVTVDTGYHDKNNGGNEFLTVSYRPKYDQGVASNNNHFVGQQAFRLLYFPSGDSIYINAFQAAYLPSYDKKLITPSTKDWSSQKVLLYYTYRATEQNLDTAGLATPLGAFPTDKYEWMRTPLRNGYKHNKGPERYRFYHKLYVDLQSLQSGKTELTLTSGKHHKQRKIDTHINFDLYDVCKLTADQPILPPDLYLIRNEEGQYLHVPLYSASDSAVWITLSADVHPELIPSFQWVVEKMNPNSSRSRMRITNREFEWLSFDRIKVVNGSTTLAFLDKFSPTKGRKINFKYEPFKYDKHSKKVDPKKYSSFLALSGKSKSDDKLGYTWIHPDSAVTKAYGLNYLNGIDDSNFLGWDGNMNEYPNTDTVVFAKYKNYFDKLYFSLDTLKDPDEQLQEYGYKVDINTNQIKDLVTLKRTRYRITYNDPVKMMCNKFLNIVPAEQGRYALGKRGNNHKVLGRPLFYLRNVYNKNNQDYFALVQTVDTVVTDSSNVALKDYLTAEFGKLLSNKVMNRLLLNGVDKFNKGLFVASVDDQTARLKMTVRADAVTRVSTFRLVEDNEPIYRRFNDSDELEFERKEFNDAPRVLKFHRQRNEAEVLFENTGAIANGADKQINYWLPGKRHYLGMTNIIQNPNTNTDIYVDTAYINRPGGDVKPQYMLMVRPQIVPKTAHCEPDQDSIQGYTRGHYLINATDSVNFPGPDKDERYRWQESWERFVFVDAIHANDTLYILEGSNIDTAAIMSKPEGYYTHRQMMIDPAKLMKLPAKDKSKKKSKGVFKIGLGNNYHKDCVYQFRLIERRALDFLIESETTDRDPITGPMIKPCEGGWLKIHNGVPVISRSDVDAINFQPQGDIFNVKRVDMEDANPVANDMVNTSDVTVVAGIGEVTILNAAGKQVVINNVLGQTVAKTLLSSDNATIAAPQGVVIVTVEGEAAQKTLVK